MISRAFAEARDNRGIVFRVLAVAVIAAAVVLVFWPD